MSHMNLRFRAPDFPSRGRRYQPYPSSGRHIGPAWIQAYALVYNGGDEYVDSTEVANKVAETHDLAPGTILNLLRTAAGYGLLEAEVRLSGEGRKRWRAHYRVPKSKRLG